MNTVGYGCCNHYAAAIDFDVVIAVNTIAGETRNAEVAATVKYNLSLTLEGCFIGVATAVGKKIEGVVGKYDRHFFV